MLFDPVSAPGGLVPKGQTAVSTLEGLLARMGLDHVRPEPLVLLERPGTVGALDHDWLIHVPGHVCGQSLSGFEDLKTDLASLLPLFFRRTLFETVPIFG